MNILIPDSWLREHLKTKATPKQIGQYLSLCSQSVEKIKKEGSDFVYNIEITTNRPDCLSIYGIARELAVILPRFGIKAELQGIAEFKKPIPKVKQELPLTVKITQESLCPRFTALIFDQVTIKPSPLIIRERLSKSSIRSLNNVVDISNYLMLELGQPMHTFDYDKIKKAKMILRESKAGEKIITLDGQKRLLPAKTIIIEDGEGRIIDLCGIMGGQNSEVDKNTKRVLLFVQTYEPAKIRQTCQKLAFRTEAAQRFERGVDPEGVIPAIKKAATMFKNSAGAKVASQLIDIYSAPQQIKKVKISQEKINQLIGIDIKLTEAKKILEGLGFRVKLDAKRYILEAAVPHWRYDDISIPEDLVEEIARIYGYHQLPNFLPPIPPLEPFSGSSFEYEKQIKQILKFWGFIETTNYSMTSSHSCLEIANPLSKDLVYMRSSLVPSLLEVMAENENEEKIKIFELSHVYIPQASNKLPKENLRLAGIIKGEKFFQAKGFVEAILSELGIVEANFKSCQPKNSIFHPSRTAQIIVKNQKLGYVGETKNIKNRVAFFDLDFDALVKQATKVKKYTPLPKHPAIIEDLTFVVPEKRQISELIQLIKSASLMIQSVELIDTYENSRTFQITYQDPKRNLTRKEVEKIRKKIIKQIKEKFNANLKESLRLSS